MQKHALETFLFKDDGFIPNHSSLEVVFYPQAVTNPQSFSELFPKHNWKGGWTGDVYPYHHYHSETHEVLGVISGQAELQLGGEYGKVLSLKAGDVIIIPAGVAHKKLSGSKDFEVYGAYPDGREQYLDQNTGKPEERVEAIKKIRHVPLPKQDPVFGESGQLLSVWDVQFN